ncbi:MAG: putative glycosyltransferase EpsF [Betaproteobacteria bacterium ADurb.Bin341]|nr:MAG: putative glycosyltransferase EpsF [Betaproteobacteria bacterium ADurb.Bin341]
MSLSSSVTDRRIRVLHIINGLNVGGAERMLWKLLAQADRDRFDMRVLNLLKGGQISEEIKALGIPVGELNLHSPYTAWKGLFALRSFLRQTDPDVVQGWMYHGNLAAWCATKMARRKTAQTWGVRHSLHDMAREKKTTQAVIRLCAWLSGSPDRILFNSERSRLQHEAIGYNPAVCETIPNGFDVAAYRPDAQARQHLRAEFGLAPEMLLVGLVARFHPLKDQPGFIKAARLVSPKFPDVHFVLVGREVERNNPALDCASLPLEILKKFHFLGERSDIPHITAGLDVAVSSSISEGFPNTIGEAMSCGLPCVVTDVGDSAWLLGECGRVVPPSDPQALAAALVSLLELPEAERKRLGAEARQRVIELFSIDAVTERYQQLYRALCPHKAA